MLIKNYVMTLITKIHKLNEDFIVFFCLFVLIGNVHFYYMKDPKMKRYGSSFLLSTIIIRENCLCQEMAIMGGMAIASNELCALACRGTLSL